MSLLDEDLLKCFFCNNRFESPVLMPCNEAICLKHIKELCKQNSIECPNCKQTHDVPEDGFPSDKKIQQILILQRSQQKAIFIRLNELYEKYVYLKKNPFFSIQSYFEKMKITIFECRDKNKKILDDLFEKYLEEMLKLEIDEKEKIGQQLKPYPSDDDSNSSDYWRAKIEKLNQQSDKKNVHTLKTEVLKLERKLEKKIISMEQNSMPKNVVVFVGKLLENVELGRFEKKKNSRDGPIHFEQSTSTQIMCLAIRDHNSKDSNELSVRKGDTLFVREKFGQNLWLATRDEQIGYVSSTLLAEIWDEEWFVGKMDRTEVESLLSEEKNMPGTFLVRFCTPINDSQIYSLSVKNRDGNIKHYTICRELDPSGFWSYWLKGAKCKFNSIKNLIASYSQKSNGLCIELSSPCYNIFSI